MLLKMQRKWQKWSTIMYTFILKLMIQNMLLVESYEIKDDSIYHHFTTVESLYKHKHRLKKMFLSNLWWIQGQLVLKKGKKWKGSSRMLPFGERWILYSNQSSHLWKWSKMLIKFPSMTKNYYDVQKANKEIKEVHGVMNRSINLTIINKRWENQLHHPLHATAYFLNLVFRYREDFMETFVKFILSTQ